MFLYAPWNINIYYSNESTNLEFVAFYVFTDTVILFILILYLLKAVMKNILQSPFQNWYLTCKLPMVHVVVCATIRDICFRRHSFFATQWVTMNFAFVVNRLCHLILINFISGQQYCLTSRQSAKHCHSMLMHVHAKQTIVGDIHNR